MSDSTTFQPVTSESPSGESHASESPETSPRIQRMGELLSIPWIFAGGWIAICLAIPLLFYGFGRATGTLGMLYEGGIGTTALWAGGFAAPFAVGKGLMLARRSETFQSSNRLHYGILLVASLGAPIYGPMILAIGGYALTLGHNELVMEPWNGWGFVLIGGLSIGGLVGGMSLFQDQVGADTFRVMGVWLVCATCIHLFLADPDFHLFMGLGMGGGGGLLLSFAAARPLYTQDPVMKGWGARLQYYLGALFFTFGTLFLFLFAEALMFAVTGGESRGDWASGGGLF